MGEHAVVYGHPAIAFPISELQLAARAWHGHAVDPGHPVATTDSSGLDTEENELARAALRLTLDHLGVPRTDVDASISGSIPTARGLGSSAAMSSALAVAVAELHGRVLSPGERFDIVQSVEKIAHGTPSGLDAHATMAPGPLWFEKPEATPLDLPVKPALLVADTGYAGHTLDAVRDLRLLREKDPERVNPMLARIGELTHLTRDALLVADMHAVGAAMNECHEILRDLDLSHPALETLVGAACDAGARGAKLTGGGRGGCMIALAEDADSIPALEAALRAAGATHVWPV